MVSDAWGVPRSNATSSDPGRRIGCDCAETAGRSGSVSSSSCSLRASSSLQHPLLHSPGRPSMDCVRMCSLSPGHPEVLLEHRAPLGVRVQQGDRVPQVVSAPPGHLHHPRELPRARPPGVPHLNLRPATLPSGRPPRGGLRLARPVLSVVAVRVSHRRRGRPRVFPRERLPVRPRFVRLGRRAVAAPRPLRFALSRSVDRRPPLGLCRRFRDRAAPRVHLPCAARETGVSLTLARYHLPPRSEPVRTLRSRGSGLRCGTALDWRRTAGRVLSI